MLPESWRTDWVTIWTRGCNKLMSYCVCSILPPPYGLLFLWGTVQTLIRQRCRFFLLILFAMSCRDWPKLVKHPAGIINSLFLACLWTGSNAWHRCAEWILFNGLLSDWLDAFLWFLCSFLWFVLDVIWEAGTDVSKTLQTFSSLIQLVVFEH